MTEKNAIAQRKEIAIMTTELNTLYDLKEQLKNTEHYGLEGLINKKENEFKKLCKDYIKIY